MTSELSHTQLLWLVVSTMTCIDCLCFKAIRNELEFPEPLDKAIKSYHGSTLDEVMEALRDERLEYLAVCDMKGKVLAEGTLLSPAETAIADSDQCKITGECISVHNHPSSNELAFSAADIKTLRTAGNWMAEIVVTANFTYTLRWVSAAQRDKIDVEEFCDYVNQVFGDIRIFFTCSSARRYYNRQIKKIADRYGLIFTVADLHREKDQAWLARNWKRASLVASCVALALGIICHPVETSRDDLPVAVSIEEVSGKVNGHIAPPID